MSKQTMIEHHLRRRGIRDANVLAAMEAVPREAFVPPGMVEFAYEDRPLPIASGQTISQPYIVALMTQALRLTPGDRVLEIGTGSGYAAAVLGRIAKRVDTIERHRELGDAAAQILDELGYRNVHVHIGDGTLGWPERAPYQAIVVTAGGPEVPQALLDQLAVGGRLVIPVGDAELQELVRVTRVSADELRHENLGGVRFVPLIGAQGWKVPAPLTEEHPSVWPPREEPLPVAAPPRAEPAIGRLIADCAEPIADIDEVDLSALIERIGDARVVLIGEATHGTSEFYRMRARITQELILRCGFTAVAIEGDWPDCAVVDRYVRGLPPRPRTQQPFSRFPTWMWRNVETRDFLEWLRAYNAEAIDGRRVSFSGLDLYSMFWSAHEVVRYLERVDPVAAESARQRYGCLTPWQRDPAAYGRAAVSGRLRSCEDHVVTMLRDMLARRLDPAALDGDDLVDAAQNARVVAGAERYYRTMYYGAVASWNLRDQHMFDTLESILAHRGPGTRMVVWAHNSHVGDAAVTEMGVRGEHNIGHLCRARFGHGAYLVGFGTDRGTVTAASDWDGATQRMRVRPAHPRSYEHLFHIARLNAGLVHLREPQRDELREALLEPRLERAIGVVYRPETELESHYFQAILPLQFDEYVWFDTTNGVEELAPARAAALQPAHPFASR